MNEIFILVHFISERPTIMSSDASDELALDQKSFDFTDEGDAEDERFNRLKVVDLLLLLLRGAIELPSTDRMLIRLWELIRIQ